MTTNDDRIAALAANDGRAGNANDGSTQQLQQRQQQRQQTAGKAQDVKGHNYRTPRHRDSNGEHEEPGLATEMTAAVLPDFRACFPNSLSTVSEFAVRPMKWGLWSPCDRRWMQLCQDNYEAHHRRRDLRARDGPYRIPRAIHQIWLGSPLPQAFARLQQSWKSRHEDWEMRLWTEADVEAFGLENKAAYDAAKNFGQKSDIFRYEILLRHGGLYVDVDFICLGAFDDLHSRHDFYCGVSNTGTFELNNGLIGCRAEHPIIRDIVCRIRKTCTPPTQQSPEGGTSRTGATCPRGNTGPSVLDGATTAAAPGSGSSLAVEVMGDSGGLGGLRDSGTIGAVDPLAALIGGLASLGAGERGLLAGLLGGDDRERLNEAMKVEPGSAAETIAKTGPGVFTMAVMEWISSAATSNDAIRSAIADLSLEHTPLSSHAYETSDAIVSTTMVLPPSYFYPVPNDIKGDLVGDGREDAIRGARAGQFFREESLAAHLWAKSWQQENKVGESSLARHTLILCKDK